MNNSIDHLSQLILEADALLLLLHKHKEETPSDAIVMLKRKLQVILSLIDDIEEEESAEYEERSEADVKIPEPDVEVQESTSKDEDPVVFMQPDVVEMPSQEDEPAIDPTWDHIADEFENIVEGASVTDAESEANSEVEKVEPRVLNTVVAQPQAVRSQLPDEKPIEKPLQTTPQILTTPIVEPVVEPASAPAPMPKNTSRRPVSTVFNLNDKFRFRRELFGNSEIAYVECMNMLSAMYSLDEATEYLYEDLNWDPNNEDVKSFVELLKNYYTD